MGGSFCCGLLQNTATTAATTLTNSSVQAAQPATRTTKRESQSFASAQRFHFDKVEVRRLLADSRRWGKGHEKPTASNGANGIFSPFHQSENQEPDLRSLGFSVPQVSFA